MLSGFFEPSIFLPKWFAQNEMIGKKEAENLEISQTKHELEFKANAFELRARPNLFEIVSSDSHFEHVKDLVISCRVLENHWESSLERAEMIFDQIMELTRERENDVG